MKTQLVRKRRRYNRDRELHSPNRDTALGTQEEKKEKKTEIIKGRGRTHTNVMDGRDKVIE